MNKGLRNPINNSIMQIKSYQKEVDMVPANSKVKDTEGSGASYRDILET